MKREMMMAAACLTLVGTSIACAKQGDGNPQATAEADDAMTVSTNPAVKKDLEDAMKGEAFAYAKYSMFAAAARKNGNEELAKLFEKNANVELTEHLAEHAQMDGLVGTDADNLKNAIAGESYENSSMYPDMAKRAAAVGDKGASEHFTEVSKDEGIHRDEYKAALAKIGGKA